MSSQALEESINQLKGLYSSRITQETLRLNKRIRDLQEKHESWVAKEEEELEELIQNRIKEYNSSKGKQKKELLPSQSGLFQDKKVQEEYTEILIPSTQEKQLKSSQQDIHSELPKACFFDLSDISDSSDDNIL